MPPAPGSGSTAATNANSGSASSSSGKLQTRQGAYSLQEGEKCLVYYHDQLYEGKVMKVDTSAAGSDAKKYLVHYHGWRSSWDSWKTSAEVLKYNEENKRKQAELQKSAAAESAMKSSKKSSSNSGGNKESNAAVSGTSRKGGKTASLAGSSCSSTAGGDNLDLPSSRPGTPDSVKSEVSTASSKNAGVSDNKSQKSKSSSRGKDTSRQDESVSKKRSRKEMDQCEDAKGPEAKKSSSSKDKSEATAAAVSDIENIPATPNVETPPINQSPISSTNSPGQNSSSETNNSSNLIEMPKSLKTVLIDEYDLIMRQKRLVDLPSKKFTVSKIIDEFIESTSDECNQHVAYGVKDMFNVVLGSSLLYKFERAQYEDLLKTDRAKPMVDIYGPEHFLRFFLKINELIEEAKLSKEYTATIAPHLKTMLSFLKDKSSKYFDMKNRYIQAPAEYLRTSLNE